jgi:hypothetical protein
MTRPEGENGTPKAIPRHVKPQGRLRPRQTSLPSSVSGEACPEVSRAVESLSVFHFLLRAGSWLWQGASRRVRLMYEKGEDNVTDSEVAKAMASENGVLWEAWVSLLILIRSTSADALGFVSFPVSFV